MKSVAEDDVAGSAVAAVADSEIFVIGGGVSRAGDILIQGDEAQTACETCCSSFKVAGEGSYKNSVGTPSATVQIDCTACKCHYNENNRCMAGRVDISGQSACTCNQTECSTFEKQ